MLLVDLIVLLSLLRLFGGLLLDVCCDTGYFVLVLSLSVMVGLCIKFGFVFCLVLFLICWWL